MAERRALKPDAQAFDEIRIVTVPRFKTSGLSGDEWRISSTTQFYRKGKMVHETHSGKIEYAVQMVAAEFLRAQDAGKGYFAGEGDICDQEGCAQKATVTYKLKHEFCHQGHPSDPYVFDKRPLTRMFCERHSTRGDCALEDADRNYEVLSGDANRPSGVDESPSKFGGVISLEDLTASATPLHGESDISGDRAAVAQEKEQ